MTMASTSSRGATSGAPPSLRAQLNTTLALYEALTKLYFVLIEARAATATAAARNTLNGQLQDLRALLAGHDGDGGALATLSARHAAKLESLAVFEPMLPIMTRSDAAVGSSAPVSLASASTPTIPSVAQALDAVDEIMAELIDRSRKHAANQARISAMVKDIDARQKTFVQTIERLAALREQARRLVKTGAEEEAVIDRAEKRPLDYEEILRYGRTLSQTTTAPPGFKLKLDLESAEEAGEGINGFDAAEQGKDNDEVSGRKRPLLPGKEGDGARDEAGAKGTATQIPAHLQDKLPYPSVDAMRRGASEIQMPTWEQFQRGEVGEVPASEEQAAGQIEQAGISLPVQSQARHDAKPKAPAEDQDDGFGLDLN